MGISHLDGLSRRRGADAVRDDPVTGKVAAADDVSGSGRGNRRGILCGKEAAQVGRRHQLRAALAVGVGVEAVKPLVFPVAPAPFVVPVDLVRGHVHHAFHAAAPAHALQQVHGAHDVDFVGFPGIAVALPDNGLGRQMEYDLRLRFGKDLHQTVKIPHIRPDVGDPLPEAGQFPEIRLCGGIQAAAGDDGPRVHQHPAEPAALEAGVPGDQHPLPPVKCQLHQSSHTFQGALPDCQSCSSSCFSRRVSMHCQKPSCL